MKNLVCFKKVLDTDDNTGLSKMNLISTIASAAFVYLLVVGVLRKLPGYLVWRYKLWFLPRLPQRAYPIIGHLHLIAKEPGRLFFMWKNLILRSVRENGNKMFVVWFGPTPHCAIACPKLAQEVLKLKYKPRLTRLGWLKEGVNASNGKKWMERRRMITPSFHFGVLNDFVHVINEQAATFVGKVAELEDKGDVNMSYLLNLLTLDIICETAMGVRVGAQLKTHDNVYTNAVMR